MGIDLELLWRGAYWFHVAVVQDHERVLSSFPDHSEQPESHRDRFICFLTYESIVIHAESVIQINTLVNKYTRFCVYICNHFPIP